jgi:hypothetical protein
VQIAINTSVKSFGAAAFLMLAKYVFQGMDMAWATTSMWFGCVCGVGGVSGAVLRFRGEG